MKTSSRRTAVILSIVTLILLLGSVLLQNIYFKADQISSSVFFSPTTFTAQPNQRVELAIKAVAEGTAVIGGAQFSIEYDQRLLRFESVESAASWQLIDSKTENGVTTIVFLPEPSTGAATRISQEATFGIVVFTALSEGQGTIRYRASDTIISAFDTAQEKPYYNAIRSLQDATGLISVSGRGATSLPRQVLSETTAPVVSGQKVLEANVLPAASAAHLLVRLQYAAPVVVRFGTSTELLSTLESTEAAEHHSLQLSGLSPDTRYYYSLEVFTVDKKSSIRSQLRSFVTAPNGSGVTDQSATLIRAFPETARNETQIIVALRDTTQSAVAVSATSAVVGGDARVVTQTTTSGIHTAVIQSLSPVAQTVRVATTTTDGAVVSQSVVFDPNRAESIQPTDKTDEKIVLNNKALSLLFALLAGMMLFGFLFIRLAKSK